eukprot:scaffold33506_cov152-Isochrysis_galbana.AAC.2
MSLRVMGSGSECIRNHHTNGPQTAQALAPTDGAGVLSSVTLARGAGDAIAIAIDSVRGHRTSRQSDKQRATKDLSVAMANTAASHQGGRKASARSILLWRDLGGTQGITESLS